MRSRTTFNKRQKEQSRLEKRHEKAAKKLQRKAGKSAVSDRDTAEDSGAEVAFDPDSREGAELGAGSAR
jgi:hypothetical protein